MKARARGDRCVASQALLGTGKGDGGVFSPVALASAIINQKINSA